MPWEALWYAVIVASILFYTILDGFDLGVGSLHLFAKGDQERRLFLNAIGPFWDGNEVWIVIIIGGLFAGFPNAYATLFSGFYTLLMMFIAGLMFRAVAIEFRSKNPSPLWRATWDVAFCVSSILLAFVLGVILGNLIVGIPIDSEQNYLGGFADLWTPYPILIGVTAVSLFTMHGATYLSMKLEGEAHDHLIRWIKPAILFFLTCYIATTAFTVVYMPHMVERFLEMPLFALLPLFSLLAIVNIPIQVKRSNEGWAFLSSCASISLLFLLFVFGTFPMLLPSTLNPKTHSLTIYNAASSPATLKVLLLVVAIGIPLVLAYGAWIYRTFRGKVQLEHTSY